MLWPAKVLASVMFLLSNQVCDDDRSPPHPALDSLQSLRLIITKVIVNPGSDKKYNPFLAPPRSHPPLSVEIGESHKELSTARTMFQRALREIF
jgi:hypothetical protein